MQRRFDVRVGIVVPPFAAVGFDKSRPARCQAMQQTR